MHVGGISSGRERILYMMNIVTFLPKMNVMMAEDTNVPSLRSVRIHEKDRVVSKRKSSKGLWNRNFERMFAQH